MSDSSYIDHLLSSMVDRLAEVIFNGGAPSWGFMDPNIGGGVSNMGGGKQRRRQDIGSGLTPF